MTPQELKNSILQLAIQGKLVKQIKEEGTAEELYQKIIKEKQNLIKQGKIKKEKPLPEITEDEVPFDIPESWKWVRLGEVFNVIMGQSPDGNTVSKANNGLEFHQGKIFFSNLIINKSPYKTIKPSKIAPKNSLLLCVRAPVGIVNITNREICIGRGLAAVVCYSDISVYFLLYWMKRLEQDFVKKSTGTTFKAISADIVKNQILPLPPLSEQKRIVAKIEELMPLVERYAQAYERLEELNKKFPTDLKNSILQLAIQGKLVKQIKEEGTAEELYQKIIKEKEKLIKQGKIKKEKPLPEITEDEVPFDIPESWKWVRLGEVLRKLTDGSHRTPKYTLSGVKFVSVKDMSNGILSLENTKFISKSEHEELYKRCNPERGDILLSKVGTTGVPAIINTDESFSLFVSVALLKYNKLLIYEKYLYYLLKSPLVQLQATEKTRGVANKNWVLDDIASTLVPLIPFKEQKRIVAKIEELMPLVRKLE